MDLRAGFLPATLLLLHGGPVEARECTPPLPQPPHELALSMLGLADAENFACEGQTPAVRLTYFTWSGTKKVLKVFFPERGQAFIEIYEVGQAPSAVTLADADKSALVELFESTAFWQQEAEFWMMPMDRDAAQQQQLLFVEISQPQRSNLVWIDASKFSTEPLVDHLIALAKTDMGPFGAAVSEPDDPAVAMIPPVQTIGPVATPRAPATDPEVVETPVSTPVNLIPMLAGSWVFTHGQQSGVRVITPRFGGLVAEIKETFDDSSTQGVGLIAFDPSRNEYIETMTFNVVGAIGVLRGEPGDEGRRIRFQPMFNDEKPATRRVILTMASQTHFFFQMQQRHDNGDWVTTSQADFHRTGEATP